jgi:hypothetical protein
MTCKRRRQQYEWVCLRCKLRWGVDEPFPEHAMECRETPVTVTKLSDRQMVIRLAMLLVGDRTISINEQQLIVKAMQVAIDPDANQEELRTAIRLCLACFAWLIPSWKNG